MGGCLSRKNGPSSSSSSSSSLNVAATIASAAAKEPVGDAEVVKIKRKVVQEEQVKNKVEVEDEGIVKKEVFVIKHRKSHDREKPSIPCQKDVPIAVEEKSTNPSDCSVDVEINNNVGSNTSMVVRTSSCTKEEVDAILIQCGRLSRSNSSGKVASSGRKYSGSKRSYDLDQDQDSEDVNVNANASYDYKKRDSNDIDDDDCEIAERRQHRQRHRNSGGRPSPSSSSQGRRRTPSRERDQRSGSRERGSSNSGRRVSRSPGRRSETNSGTANSNATTNVNNSSSTTNRPGKMVSVPATVSSLTMDKSNNNNGVEAQTGSTAVKRISVKRNVGEAGARTAASPRSKSPARTNGRSSNENNQQQPSLSRSSSRKAEQSPCRRNPLSEIDPNSLMYSQATGNNKSNNSTSRVQTRNKEMEGQAVEKESINQVQMQKTISETNRQGAHGTNCKVISNFVREPQVLGEEAKPQALTRSRSARRSRDLDFNPETLLNPTAPSYTALLLEDIQNFHQKNTTSTTTNAPTATAATATIPSFTVPGCVTKACSILEAVADLNSTTSSNISCEDKRSSNLIGKKLTEAKDPFVESEVIVSDDLMEPSLHKYVTVRRGGTSSVTAAEDMDGQESSGSNSYVGGGGSQQQWGYYSGSSSWEPNSAESTDRWTTRSNTKEEDDGIKEEVAARKGFSGQRTGIGRGRVGSNKNLHPSSTSHIVASI
ncbi:uncharacterized protein At1g65710 [Jatropha curcas]|uniref:uncharacterized protein At1g65710 n=1 Tax=Jatropha curcas TaxID=180498 RepID=UPI001893C2B8|nr:uncharacterized protein At1g65710 [Jatropha curcas]